MTLRVALAAAWGLAMAAISAALILRFHVTLPYIDYWHFFIALERGNGALSWQDLWAQNNEHRLPFPRLLFLADVYVTRASGWLPILASVACQCGIAILWPWRLWKAGQLSRERAIVAAFLALGLAFHPIQAENFLFPFQVQIPLMVLACMLSLASTGWTSGAAAMVATGSFASGLLTWPALAVIQRRKRWWLLSVLAFLAYFWGFAPIERHGSLWDRVARPDLWIPYSLRMAGMFVAPVAPWLAALLGVLILVATLVLIRRWIVLQDLRRVLAVQAGLGLLITLATSVARSGAGFDELAPSRYAGIMMLLWIPLLLGIVMEQRWRVGLLLSVGLLIGLLPRTFHFVLAPAATMQVAEVARKADVVDRFHLSPGLPPIDPSVWVADYVRRRGWTVWRDPLPSTAFAVGTCAARVLQQEWVYDPERPGIRLQLERGRLALGRLVVVDAAGSVVGYGEPWALRLNQWIVFARAPEAAQEYRVINADQLCSVATLRITLPSGEQRRTSARPQISWDGCVTQQDARAEPPAWAQPGDIPIRGNWNGWNNGREGQGVKRGTAFLLDMDGDGRFDWPKDAAYWLGGEQAIVRHGDDCVRFR